ncbi:cupredoxin domain-containing protein [Streptococcus mutans]|uniref:cupredoxin domain-containing protein n=1 Tax=Streptococcus mutans TaxID=1309 RepID=UPI0002B5E376|nr:cupredoxin domain-containing protein [Streptococcus mutans]EMC36050.1 copper -translocating P-type ATPase [Streptococcus mutans 21]EMC46547.1 copper -translocating P-type ATPase [Streptococcus mutans 24]MCY7128059.1 cupredoxin domain-containing protein [Streptococcus mutans]MDT9562213.1 cupredoxin domain-containing protein [Streptococcus mutans]MDT9565907.1 cupredoxin domain-containing protein [Streptococcus mutans]
MALSGLFNRSNKARVKNGRQAITISVKDGYKPETIILQKGISADITFNRKNPSGCLSQVKMKDFAVLEDLPLNEKHTVTIQPNREGTYEFSCGMEMYKGKIVVK